VERLADEDGVDAIVLDGDRLCRARAHVAVADQRAHRVVRLDRDHVRVPPRELGGEPSRSRGQVENVRVRVELERGLRAIEQLLRVGRPDAVVRLGEVAEA
jgi:hypothetical protein